MILVGNKVDPQPPPSPPRPNQLQINFAAHRKWNPFRRSSRNNPKVTFNVGEDDTDDERSEYHFFHSYHSFSLPEEEYVLLILSLLASVIRI